jgi:hypothetical protein
MRKYLLRKPREITKMGLSAPHRLPAIFTLSFLLASCGGGGGDTSTTPPTTVASGSNAQIPAKSSRQPPPTLVQDTNPPSTGSFASLNMFPLNVGDYSDFNKVNAAGVAIDQMRIRVEKAQGNVPNTVSVVELEALIKEVDRSEYFVDADGVSLTAANDPSFSNIAKTIIGKININTNTAYQIGAERIQLRRGSLGKDLTGDGVDEGFSLKFSQIFLGFQTVTLSNVPLQVARFKNTFTVTLMSSNPADADVSTIATEDSFYAPNYGLVKSVRSEFDERMQPTAAPYTLFIYEGNINGKWWTDGLFSDGSIVRTDVLRPAEVVYSPVHKKYFGLEPTADSFPNPNRVFSVDALSGTVERISISGNPSTMAISADGLYAYLGLKDTGEVVKYSVSPWLEVSRFLLPQLSNSLGTPIRVYAEGIAVAPSDSNRIVVKSTTDYSPGSVGVSLYDGTSRTQFFNGYANLATFPSNIVGNQVIFGASDLEFFLAGSSTLGQHVLSRFQITGGSISQTQSILVQNFKPDFFADPESRLSLNGAAVAYDNAVFAQSNLAFKGPLPGKSCEIYRITRVACLVVTDLVSAPNYIGDLPLAQAELRLFDSATLLQTGKIRLTASPVQYYGSGHLNMTKGPVGQFGFSGYSGIFQLFNHPSVL